MNTTENNKLIASFMELKRGIYPSRLGKGYYENTPIGDVEVAEANLLPYHTSWDWLMPVVEKIGKIDNKKFSIEIDFNVFVWCQITRPNLRTITMKGSDPKEVTYKAVVEFIKDYNN